MGQVIVAVIAVVVAYYTAGALSGPLSGVLGQTGGAIAAGAAGGAAGSVASQGVGVAIGAQDSFSWKGVALGAVSGAITGGLARADFGAGTVGNRVIQAATASASTQGIAVALGLQEQFSWRNVAVSAVSAGVAQGINSATGYDPRDGFDLGKSLVSGLGASVVSQVARGGRVSATQLASDAFGTVIGDSLAQASGVPAPASDRERQTIMGYFADGPGTGSPQSITLHDGSVISAAENLRRTNLFRASAYASNEKVDPSQRVTSDAGSGTKFGGTLRDIVVRANEDDGLMNGEPTTFGEFANPWGQAPYNPNWQADIVRSTLESAMAQQARRNSGPVLTASNPAADAAAALARQRSANNLAGAVGGPFVGGPMQLARLSGLDEYKVQDAGILGMAAQDALGMKGAGSAVRMASARGKGASPVIGAERAYLNQKFGRTGDLDVDINARGAGSVQRTQAGVAGARSGAYIGNATTAGVVPDGLAFRVDLPDHLIGPDGFTKTGNLSGTHNLSNAIAALDAKGATYSLTPTLTDGISELSYSYVKPTSGKLISGSKTVYDPSVFSDQTMLNYALSAGQDAWIKYLANPGTTSFDIRHGGVNFRAYVNVNQYGNPYIGNVHPIK